MKQKFALTVMVLLALIIGTAIRDKMPNPADAFAAPYEVTSDSAPHFGRVSDVNARKVSSFRGMSTSETFIQVDFTFTPNTYEASPRARLVDGKNRILDSVRLPECEPMQTDLPARCTVAFEVARDALSGAKLRLNPGFSDSGAAVIVLPIDTRGGA